VTSPREGPCSCTHTSSSADSLSLSDPAPPPGCVAVPDEASLFLLLWMKKFRKGCHKFCCTVFNWTYFVSNISVRARGCAASAGALTPEPPHTTRVTFAFGGILIETPVHTKKTWKHKSHTKIPPNAKVTRVARSGSDQILRRVARWILQQVVFFKSNQNSCATFLCVCKDQRRSTTTQSVFTRISQHTCIVCLIQGAI